MRIPLKNTFKYKWKNNIRQKYTTRNTTMKWNIWCFRPRLCNVRLYWAEDNWANGMNFVMIHAPGAGSMDFLTAVQSAGIHTTSTYAVFETIRQFMHSEKISEMPTPISVLFQITKKKVTVKKVSKCLQTM